jgi:site-specific DNA-methyltransferase (adenine-specific)
MSAYMPKSKSDKWATPSDLYNQLNERFNFNFDPCPIDWKEGDPNGLEIEWGSSSFCNPPYSNVAKWIQKAAEEHRKGKKVVMLINAITDTKAFHEYIYKKPGVDVEFLKGRIKFVKLDGTVGQASPKASMLVIFN